MARFSFLLVALSVISPAFSQDRVDGQTKGLQVESVSKGLISENPAYVARLRLRQTTQCVDPGYYPCADGRSCCPPTHSCCPTDCCPNGTRCCPGGGCVYPGGECCGGGWSCPAGEKCVPGIQSLCYTRNAQPTKTESCPSATTTTSTVTEETKIASTTTRTVTQTPDEEELPEFSCPPMTVTNDLGDTLALGDDCALEFTPSTATANAAVNGNAAEPRAAPCPAQSTSTVTTTTTKASSYRVTVTTTKVVAETPPAEFSCAPMSVTNSFGDELAMDEQCALEFSPGSQTGDPNPPPTATQPGAAGRSSSGSYPMIFSLAALAVALAW
ncbi:hypothetical protein FQN54_007762 [Arachnomyces sp. PD_36]|nr:hypothetical protein FQN54_007762 [Arachnomyces sp. PD_36]